MYTNTDCTVYSKTDEGYLTVHIPACYWQEIKAQEVKKYGAENADSIQVIIPLSSLEGYGSEWSIPENSLISKCSFDIESESDISAAILAGFLIFRITSVSDHLSGSENVQHITVMAR